VRPGDPLSAREGLLEHQAFLRRLARSLVADPHGAEDLAQDAAVIALERPPPDEGSFRGWLARVVRNRAIDAARKERRREDRERNSAPPGLPRTPEETEEHLQVQRRVFDAVAALEEPYRTVIVLRYYHELGPAEIAKQLGVPLSTVKSRLARALAQLREDLDDSQPRGARAWAVVLAGGLGELPPPPVAAVLAAGGIAMGVKLALGTVAACGVLALGGWWLRRPESAPANKSLASDISAGALQAVHTERELALLEPQVEGRRAAIEAVDSTSRAATHSVPAFSLALEVRGLDEDVRGPISLAIHSGSPPLPTWTESRALEPTITLDLGPLFDGVEVRPDQIAVRLDHPAYLPAQVSVLVPEELRKLGKESGQLTAAIDLVRAKAIVTGKVEIPASSTEVPARVAILAFERDAPSATPIELSRPDAEGRFRLRADGAERHVVVAMDERALAQDPLFAIDDEEQALRPESTVMTLAPGEERDLGTLRLTEGESIEGRVSATAGAEPPPGRVFVQLQGSERQGPGNLAWIDGRYELRSQSARWADNGEFRVVGLGATAFTVEALPRANSPAKRSMWLNRKEARVTVRAPARGVQLPLERVSVTIEVRGDGVPIPRAGLRFFTYLDGEATGQSGSGTDELGRLTIELDPGAGLHVEASAPGYEPKELRLGASELTSSDHFPIDLVGPPVEPATLVLAPTSTTPDVLEAVVLDVFLYETSKVPANELEAARGRPSEVSQSGANGRQTDTVHVSPPDGWLKVTREGFARVVTGIRPGRYLVRIGVRADRLGTPCFVLSELFELELASGQRAVQDWRPRLGGTVRFNLSGAEDNTTRAELVGMEGDPLNVQVHWTDAGNPGNDRSGTRVPLKGVSEIRTALVPGSYHLRIRQAGQVERRVTFQIEAGRATDVVLDLGQP
jgi:RNA polymerase sigma-70 factor (ECF subfamily)